jgi:hypothetical protein
MIVGLPFDILASLAQKFVVESKNILVVVAVTAMNDDRYVDTPDSSETDRGSNHDCG